MKALSRYSVLVGVCLLASLVSAQAQDWQPLGETIVDFRSPQETINATDTETQFSKIRMQVVDADMDFTGLKVYFSNGQTAEIAFKRYVGSARFTPAIELPDKGAGIEKVEFSFRNNVSRSRLGRVRLFAAR